MADTPAQRKAKRAWEERQRIADPEGYKLRMREAQIRYREKHKERLAERRKQKRLENLEAERARGRAEYAKNPEARRAAAKRWKQNNKERVREYQRGANIKRYNLTIEQKDAMFEAQGRTCACCGSPDPRGKRGWHIDHCHKTGEVRGLLCLYCNVALGKVQDSVEHLQKLIAYLSR